MNEKPWKRTHSCGALRKLDAGKPVTLAGWVHRFRDLGSIVFMDLRDRDGLTQIMIDMENPAHSEEVRSIRSEFVVTVKGKVRERGEENVNADMATGDIEVLAEEVRILNRAQTPPFVIDESSTASEELRLKYRYLDLRRPPVLRNLRLRHEIFAAARNFLDRQGFIEVETPCLVRSTPEGSRDYLVPSRVHKGKFYALPQSPQLFKQLLMVAGFDKYYQIARCYRDEDLRADRQPEFTQLDMEMSFVEPEDIFAVVEPLIQEMARVVGIALPSPFPRLTYDEAIRLYGSDKPDLRFEMTLSDLDDVEGLRAFRVFDAVLAEGGRVAALAAPGAADEMTRKKVDALTEEMKKLGAKGLMVVKVGSDGFDSPLRKHVPDDVLKRIQEKTGARPGDAILVVADKPATASAALGALRLRMAEERGLRDRSRFAPLWVTDFPMFEYSEAEKKLVALHHPFTHPNPEHLDILENAPERVKARAYDVILNGSELGGGSIRIHVPELQSRVFRILGLTEEQASHKFGFFLQAMQYGAPPHGGIALGLDRVVVILTGGESIRDVIAFPKTTSAACLMSESPSTVEPEQLKELGIRLDLE